MRFSPSFLQGTPCTTVRMFSTVRGGAKVERKEGGWEGGVAV